MTSILALDQGTTGSTALVVHEDGRVLARSGREFAQHYPAPGWVEHDAEELFRVSVAVMGEAVAAAGSRPVALGITNQRETVVLWDRATLQPVAPAIVWQDRRTTARCRELREAGLEPMLRRRTGLVADPYFSATKLEWLLLDRELRRRAEAGELAFGTMESWLVASLTGGLHVSDHTNASRTLLYNLGTRSWDDDLLGLFSVPRRLMPEIVPSSGVLGDVKAEHLGFALPIAGLAGDQQASLLGQACIAPGVAKVTFGTGGMLDTVVGGERPSFAARGGHGCFPIVAHRLGGVITWGVEAAMLSAGTNVEWLRDDLGLIPTAEASHEVAASVPDTGGAWYVPALLGLGTPRWDYGARGTLLGITRGTTAAHVVRAVLEGVAHRGADLVEAAEADGGAAIDVIRVDGGMSANPTFVQAVADAADRPVEVSPIAEATTLGAGYLAGVAVGTWSSIDEAVGTWRPARTVEPQQPAGRKRWQEAVDRAAGWVPELSALEF